MKALLMIDMQYDFLEHGSLYVPKGEQIIPMINELQLDYELVVATQDWHPVHHKSFASEYPDKKPFDIVELDGLQQVLWPDHCVQATLGATLDDRIDWRRVEGIFRKGMEVQIDSYSGFFDNGKKKDTGLRAYLKGRGVEEIHICGLAADYCVYFSAMDALDLGFKTSILSQATQEIHPEEYLQKLKLFTQKGGQII